MTTIDPDIFGDEETKVLFAVTVSAVEDRQIREAMRLARVRLGARTDGEALLKMAESLNQILFLD